MDNVTLQVAVQVLNAAALAVFAWLLAKGVLVPLPVVQQFMLKPLQDRIEALEQVSRRREEQNAELQRLQAKAIEAQSAALELLHKERGGS